MAQQVEGSRRNVNIARESVDAQALGERIEAPHKQRDLHCRVVKKIAVGAFSVFQKTFTVVRCNDDERIVSQSECFEFSNETPHFVVLVRNLGVIGARRNLRVELGDR